ncbi:MAG: hypothetical protein WA755_18585 [Candidatus Acidiferrales bacterium]
MNSRRKPVPTETSATKWVDALELYEQCEAKEREIEATYKEKLQNLLEFLAFGDPLFRPDPQLDADLLGSDPLELKIEKLRRRADRNEGLIELMKKARNNDTRLIVLAIWLKHERICDPREFLPGAVYRRALQYARKGRLASNVSFADIRHGRLVKAWLPYFEQLLRDVSQSKNDPRVNQKLAKLKYKQEAIEMIRGSNMRAPVPACSAWLEQRHKGQARVIENAYSRYKIATQELHK